MTKINRINILSTKVLSVQVSLNGLSFCILDTLENTILFLHNLHFESPKTPLALEQVIKDEFSKHVQLQQDFKKVNLLHHNNLCTFVPKALYNENNLVDYLKFNNKLFESDYIATDQIDIHEIIAIYVPFVNINNFFFELFGSFDYQHSSSVLVNNLLKQANTNTTKFYCHVAKESFELVYIKNGKLQLFNAFEYSCKEDFIYYILFTLEQLQLNTETVNFILLGNIGLNDECYSLLYQYVRNVSFGSRNTEFIVRDPEQKPKYGYNHYSLLNTF